MLESLINFFETAPLEEVKEKLKKYDVKFTGDEIEKRYNIITKNISTSIVGDFSVRTEDSNKKKVMNTSKIYNNFNKFNYVSSIKVSYNVAVNDGYGEEGREVAA